MCTTYYNVSLYCFDELLAIIIVGPALSETIIAHL